MDYSKLLADDHMLLSSSVIHVVALARSLVERRFEVAGLYPEVLKQSDLLHAQVIEHFDFEETTMFPWLEEMFPADKELLARFVAAHDGLLQVLDAFRVALSYNGSGSEVLARALAFERAFEEHANAETTYFRELAARIPA